MVGYTFNSSIHAEVKGAFYEFEANLVYIVTSRLAPVPKTKTTNKQTNKNHKTASIIY